MMPFSSSLPAVDTSSDHDFLMLLAQTASIHLRSILKLCFAHDEAHAAVVVYDQGCELALVLTEAYRACLPAAQFVDFAQHQPSEIQAILANLQAHDLVVLVQSTNFRMDAYRIRVELFKRDLKVIEHLHLARMPGPQAQIYVDALAYDEAYYRGMGRALKHAFDQAPFGIVDSGGEKLYFDSTFEDAKLNVGDYREMNNVGGQFPIGEVFSEARDLRAVHGRVRIFVFGDTQFSVNQPETPITLVVEHGQVIEVEDSTPEFDKVLANIREDEGVVWVRELGFGMNRALSAERTVSDIGTFERMCGVHLSLGAKHGIYGKPGFKRGDGKYHVDVFAVTEKVFLGEQCVFNEGAWCAPIVQLDSA